MKNKSATLKAKSNEVSALQFNLLDAIDKAITPIRALEEILCPIPHLNPQLNGVISILGKALTDLDDVLNEARAL